MGSGGVRVYGGSQVNVEDSVVVIKHNCIHLGSTDLHIFTVNVCRCLLYRKIL